MSEKITLYPAFARRFEKNKQGRMITKYILRPMSTWKMWVETTSGTDEWVAHPTEEIDGVEQKIQAGLAKIWPWPKDNERVKLLRERGFSPADTSREWQLIDAIVTETESSGSETGSSGSEDEV